MRVVHVADGAKLANELGRHLLLLLRGLQKRGIDVTLVTTSNAPLGFAEGMAVVRTSNVFGLVREIGDPRPELVHLHTPFLAAEVAAVLINTPVVASHAGARRRMPILDFALRLRGRQILPEPVGVNLNSPDELGVEALRQAYEQPIVLSMTPWQNESGLRPCSRRGHD